jgi:hypothetical protein
MYVMLQMVPQWKPLATITWLARWLNGTSI